MIMSAMPANSVAAVVVTHNRLSLLKRCVATLRAQTRPLDAIIVVDNASTDGTAEWLARESGLKVITQANLGGAGGFYTGMKAAYDQGYDWLWCMDDDGLPDVDCLRQLLTVEREDLLFRAPLVLDPEDRSFLSLGYGLGSPSVFVQDRAVAEKHAQDGLLWGVAAMTNGVLIHRQVVAAIGLPLRQLFMWGDEIEYLARAKAAGFLVVTVMAAEFTHPRTRMGEGRFRFLGQKHSVFFAGHPMKDYFIVRNYGYLAKKWYGWHGLLGHMRRYFLFYLCRRQPLQALKSLVYSLEGVCGKWNGHERFLK
jgi:rhamnopyranosyl-N-acetylglucosaminyl-diphospho-decaprenol beta-1,3/1,4-galactofuranosyltransferase